MNQLNELKPGRGEYVDAVLTRFFRAEMPHPWPECAASAQARQIAAPKPFRVLGRLALAASVVLFFVGYLTLAEFFPPAENSPTEAGPNLASKPGKSHRISNPMELPKK